MREIFVVHASEDKDAVARPIAKALAGHGFTVFYDEFSLKLGDSLRQAIEQALASCDYGLVILSPNFFRKRWTQFELDGLTAREMVTGKKVILPVSHELNEQQLVNLAPALSAKLAAETRFGTPFVVNMIEEAIKSDIGGVEDSTSAYLFGFQNLRYIQCPQCARPFRAAFLVLSEGERTFTGPCPNCGFP